MADEQLVFDRAMAWVKKNTIDGNGICVTSAKQYIYPEVTGYFIPTLLEWGEDDLAVSYAKYLMSIQKEDGAWYDSEGKLPYVFDTGQILKGLVAIREKLPEADEHIRKACDWMLSRQDESGALRAPEGNAWNPGECEETIHTYCLSPIRDAGRIFGRDDYVQAAQKALAYYIEHDRESILGFGQISHFHAYVMEALADMGETDLCRQAMTNLERYRNPQGGIPAFKDVPWICSTGCFQLAVVWYKLGEKEKGDSLFHYTCRFQNPSGGWYGSYPESKFKNLFRSGRMKPGYFAIEEPSWVNKYYLDALYLKENAFRREMKDNRTVPVSEG